MPISDEELAKRKEHFIAVILDLVDDMCKEEDGVGAVETMNLLQMALSHAQSINTNAFTVEGWLDLWLSNFRYNYLTYVHDNCKDVRQDIDLKGKTTLVVGAGPSVTDEQLSYTDQFDVVCTNKALERVLKYTVPKLCVVIDGTPGVLRSFENFKNTDDLWDVPILAATTIHPTVADHLHNIGATVYWFNPSIPGEYAPNVNYALKMFSDNKLPTIDTGGNAGLFSVAMAKMLGSEDICLLGLEHAHALSPKWNFEECQSYKIVYDPRDDMTYAIPPSFQGYINTLVGYIKENPQIRWRNFTKFGWLYTRRFEIPIGYIRIQDFVWENFNDRKR